MHIPERALTDQDVEVYWGRDRDSLRACGSMHYGLVKWGEDYWSANW